MLKRDGRWTQWRSRLALWRMVGRFFVKVAPAMLRSLKPGHHPDHTDDPTWVKQGRQAYANKDPDHLPLLNTRQGATRAR